MTEEIRTGTVGVGKGAVKVCLGFPANKPVFSPETATKGHDTHHERHARNMGLTLKEWKQEAADLLNAEPAPAYLDWYQPDIKVFRRYDLRTGRLVSGTNEGEVKTYFDLDKSKRRIYLPKEYLALSRRKN
ncbi:MAG: hypothetical protein IJS96_07205 [Schwartzia sp.]|nr:hypothetical protein [Schwartzia sp. (in: firmicutes)]